MRVLVLAIATEGGAYDAMKRVLVRHKQGLPEGWDHKFVYGAGYAGAVRDDDIVVDDVQECLVPGVMRKTLAALLHHEGYDYVVRTNLSTVWLWPRLAALLEAAPRTGFSAGCIDEDCGPHMCGCGMIWSGDVARRLVADPAILQELAGSKEPDDVALSAVLRRVSSYTPVPRLDSYSATLPPCAVHPGSLHWAECMPRVSHVRFKGADRALDAATMDCFQRVVTARPEVELMLALHAAQVSAMGAATAP